MNRRQESGRLPRSDATRPYLIASGGSSIEQVVKGNGVGLNPQDVTVTASWESWDPVNRVWIQDNVNAKGSVVRVQVSYPFRLVTGPLILSQNTIQLRSTSRMIVAN